MKRCLFILLALLLLIGCSAPTDSTVQMQLPFDFYYRTVKTDFNSENGLICPQTWDLGSTQLPSLTELFALYMQGPEGTDLILPIPKDAKLTAVTRRQGLVEFHFSEEYLTASGIELSIADACLAKTAFQLENVIRVRILVEGSGSEPLRDTTLEKNDIVLFDDGNVSDRRDVTLYFADSAGRYLLADRRTPPPSEDDRLPHYIVEQLIAGPQTAGMYPTLPEGTALLDLNVEDGICAVDFNGDFFTNRPTTERGEQLALLSVVNSLCTLDEIDQVQFYIEGKRLSNYTYLDIFSPFHADSSAVGPIRAELNEFDGTLFLPSPDDLRLHSLCARIRLTGNQSRADALIRTLLTSPSQNGLINPFITDTASASITVRQGICSVEFPEDPLPGDDPELKAAAIRAIIATLAEQPGITYVRITVQDVLVNSEGLRPMRAWFCSDS